MTDNGSLLLVAILGFIFGRKSILHGFITGIITGTVLFVIFSDISVTRFAADMIWTSALSVASSVLGRIIIPGIRGGKHNCGPTYIGGGSGYSGIGGGIIHTDEERKNRIDNERTTP